MELIDKVNLASGKVSKSCELTQKQITHELENERLYLEMAAWCEDKGLTQTAKFFFLHAAEEKEHAMDFFNHLSKQGKRAYFGATKEMKTDFSNLSDLLSEAVKREQETTELIQKLLCAGKEDKSLVIDIAMKYIEEQLEEEQLFISLQNLWKICDGSKIDFEMEVMKLKCNDTYKLGNLKA